MLTRKKKADIIAQYKDITTRVDDVAVAYHKQLEEIGERCGEDILQTLVPTTTTIFVLLEEALADIDELNNQVAQLVTETENYRLCLDNERTRNRSLTDRLTADEDTISTGSSSPLAFSREQELELQSKLQLLTFQLTETKQKLGQRQKRETEMAESFQGSLLSNVRSFSGTDSEFTAQDYIKEIERYAKLGVWSEPQKKLVTILKLTGKAKAASERSKWEDLGTFEDLKIALKKYFGERMTTSELAKRYENLIQGDEESVSEYASRVRDITEKYFSALGLETGKWPQQTKDQVLLTFTRGLRPSLKQYMEVIDVTDFERAVDKAAAKETQLQADIRGAKLENTALASKLGELEEKIRVLTLEARPDKSDDRSSGHTREQEGRQGRLRERADSRDRNYYRQGNFGDRSYNNRRGSFGDRSYNSRRENFGDRSYNDRRVSFRDGSYNNRRENSGDRRYNNRRGDFGDTSYNNRRENSGDRSYNNRREDFGDRRYNNRRGSMGNRSYDNRREYSENRSYNRNDFQDRSQDGNRRYREYSREGGRRDFTPNRTYSRSNDPSPKRDGSSSRGRNEILN